MSEFEQVHRLYMQYAHGMDRRNFELARGIFIDDCQVVGTYSEGPIDEYFRNITKKVQKYAVTMHLIGNVKADFDKAAGTASAECYTVVHHLDPLDGGHPWTIAVCYSDALRRGPEGWRVVKRHVSKFWEKDCI